MHKVVFSMSGGRQFTLSFLQLMLKYPADSQIIGHQIRSTGNISVSFIKNYYLITEVEIMLYYWPQIWINMSKLVKNHHKTKMKS